MRGKDEGGIHDMSRVQTRNPILWFNTRDTRQVTFNSLLAQFLTGLKFGFKTIK